MAAKFKMADLLREGQWTKHRKCFEVGMLHINMFWSGTEYKDPKTGLRTSYYHVVIHRGPRLAYDTNLPLHTNNPKDDFSSTGAFMELVGHALDAGVRAMAIDHPAFEAEAIEVDGEPHEAAFARAVPC